MADPKAKKPEQKAAPKKAKAPMVSRRYEQGTAKNQSCPKCGKGYFLAQHTDRLTCGKCGYTEFLRK